MRTFWLLPLILVCLVPATAVRGAPGTLYPEKVYNEAWCKLMKGAVEVRFDDSTRVDCLLKHYAVEVEFAAKYMQATGQANHYARKAKLKAGILLILESKSDIKYWINLKADLAGKVVYMKLWCIAPFPLTIKKTKCFRLIDRSARGEQKLKSK